MFRTTAFFLCSTCRIGNCAGICKLQTSFSDNKGSLISGSTCIGAISKVILLIELIVFSVLIIIMDIFQDFFLLIFVEFLHFLLFEMQEERISSVFCCCR